MSASHTINREVLQAEAQLLKGLIDQHREDLQTRRSGTRFIYFIDAHELKAYLSANDKDMLEGFIFDVETLLETAGLASQVHARVRLKAEQVHRRLLLEQPQDLLLFPTHIEEMDDAMAFYSQVTLPQDADLAGIARQQWAALLNKGVSRKYLANLATLDQASKKNLLSMLTAEVPALVRLLFPAGDTVKSRLDTLITGSRVLLLAQVDWRRMGFTPEQTERLSSCAPSSSDLELWIKQLAVGRRNTVLSNRRDATALAYLTALNRCFAEIGVKAKACLITRAVTLLKTMRALRNAGHAEATDCIRHSRLVVTSVEDDELTPVGDHTLNSLHAALQSYDQRLAIHLDTDMPAPVAEAQELLSAWNAFEDARLTIEFSQETAEPRATNQKVPKAVEERRWRELARWLQSDSEITSIVEQGLQRQVAYFSAAMMERDAAMAKQAPVRVFDIPGTEYRRVQAIEVNGLGPLELHERFFADSSDFRFEKDALSEDVSEDFLALAFAQGCRKHWTLARFYARQAAQSASLLKREDIRIEARLLLAQLLRAGSGSRIDDPEDEDKAQRLGTAAQLLVSRSGRRIEDPRADAEWWALQLERLVDVRTGGSATGPELTNGVVAIDKVLSAREHPLEVRVRLQELLLAFVLLGLRRWKSAKGVGKPDFTDLAETVKHRHAGLIADMDQLRLGHEVDEIPQFSRAMEIIGYDLPRRLANFSGIATAEEPAIPAALLFDIVTLQTQLTLHTDEVSKAVAAELVRVIDRTRGRRTFTIVYAPVADRRELADIFRTLTDQSARSSALRANEIVYELGNSQLFLEGHQSERDKIAEGIQLIDRALSMPDMALLPRYHLEVEFAYLQMLGALAETDDFKRSALERVANLYDRLIERYPDSAVLHYRLSVVLGDLDRHDEELVKIAEAMRLMLVDDRINADHWFRSVVRRRLSLRFSGAATEMRDRVKDVNDLESKQQYLSLMAKAYALVSEGGSYSRAGATYIDRLEARRRLNNQVYTATLYLCGGGSMESLSNLSRERLLDLIRQLHSDGEIKDVLEIDIAHTIGTAYSTLGEFNLAAEAGERIVHLIAQSGDDAESEPNRQILKDAFSWMRGDRKILAADTVREDSHTE